MIDLLSNAVEIRPGEIYIGSAAHDAETPPEASWLVPIKINNACVYKAQISPQSPTAPSAKPPAGHGRAADRGRKER